MLIDPVATAPGSDRELLSLRSGYKTLALLLARSDNRGDLIHALEEPMAATNGLEKFSHLEDKIYRTIELTKALRQEKDDLERQLATARSGAKQDRTAEIDQLLAEREAVRTKVQRMLEAIAAADPEIAEAINR
jgi:seryl-tRNA synthetase